jgi:predicted thioesterase
MKKEDVQFLAQIIEAMSDAEKKIEEAYSKKNIVNFEKAKKTFLELQKKAAEITR